MAFDPVMLANPDEILTFLSHVALRGKGMTTESLMDYVLDEGFTEPTYLNARERIRKRFSKDSRMPGLSTKFVSGSGCSWSVEGMIGSGGFRLRKPLREKRGRPKGQRRVIATPPPGRLLQNTDSGV